MDRLRQISQQLVPVQEWPEFNAGDTVKVSYKIKEGSKERTQIFQGTVIQRRGEGPQRLSRCVKWPLVSASSASSPFPAPSWKPLK